MTSAPNPNPPTIPSPPVDPAPAGGPQPATGPGGNPAGAGGTPPWGTPRESIPPGPAGVPTTPAMTPGTAAARGATVASYPDYPSAQQAVDYLSDNGFPVEQTSIVGTDLRLVETVLGRMTTARAALAGAGSGAWFGLLIGILFGIFTTRSWLGVVLAAVLIGAIWGAIFGAIAHAATRGRRDFISRSSLQASQYAVTVEPGLEDQARGLLTRMTWRAANP